MYGLIGKMKVVPGQRDTLISILIEGTVVAADTVALLGEGDTLALEARSPVSLMLLAGEPIGEPIAHYGPFVMNTREEIEQTLLDYPGKAVIAHLNDVFSLPRYWMGYENLLMAIASSGEVVILRSGFWMVVGAVCR